MAKESCNTNKFLPLAEEECEYERSEVEACAIDEECDDRMRDKDTPGLTDSQDETCPIRVAWDKHVSTLVRSPPWGGQEWRRWLEDCERVKRARAVREAKSPWKKGKDPGLMTWEEFMISLKEAVDALL